MSESEVQPLGLAQLSGLNRVLIRQKTAFCTGNKYVVLSPDGDLIMYAKEDTSFFGQILGGNSRAFNIDIFDTQDREVFKLRRPYTFGPDKMEVTVCGRLASVVRQQVTFMKPVLMINSAADQPVMRVKGPISTTGECDFDIFTPDKQKVGVISKKWGGVRRELCTDSDNFDISFPLELDVRYKAAIIGTCFLIVSQIYTPDKQRVDVISKKWGGVQCELCTDSDNFDISFPLELDLRFKAAIIGTCFLIVSQIYTPDKQRVDVISKKWGGVQCELCTDSDNFDISFPLELDLRFKAAIIGTCFLIVSQIYTPDKQRVDVISKKWGGVQCELCTDSDNFDISFPLELDVRYKAAIIGTCFLIVSQIYTPDKQRVDVISKKWGGVQCELCTDSDNFDISFPLELDLRFKAAIICACFLIDFLYYED